MAAAGKSIAWVEVSQEAAGTLVLRVCGDLDLASRDVIEPAVLAAIPTAGAVSLDLGDLTFCDSTGLAMFVAAHEKATAEGTVLTVGNLQPSVARVFEISGVEEMLASTELATRERMLVWAGVSSRAAQASGMVSVQAECTVDEALAMIRERAESMATTIDEIAVAVVERRMRFAPR